MVIIFIKNNKKKESKTTEITKTASGPNLVIPPVTKLIARVKKQGIKLL